MLSGAIGGPLMGGETPPTRSKVLAHDWETYSGSNSYWAVNNTWGASPFKNGPDYQQSITIDTQNFPNNTVIAWAWPHSQSNSTIYSYPEIVYGPRGAWNPFSLTRPAPMKISDAKQLSADFSFELTGNLDAVDILIESFLTSIPNPTDETTNLFEVCFFLYSGPGIRRYAATFSPQYRFAGKTFNATISLTRDTPPLVLIVPDNDIFAGTIDMLEVLNFLKASKILTGEEYIRAIEFGAEPQGNVPGPHSGKLLIRTLSYTWQHDTARQ